MRRFLTWKWLGRAALALFAIVLITPLIYYVVVRKLGQRELDAVFAQLDRDDPGWRLDDIVRDTNAKLPPDAQNPAVLGAKASALLPPDAKERFAGFPDWTDTEPNLLPDASFKAQVVDAMVGFKPAIEAARGLADLGRVGGHVVVATPNPVEMSLRHELDMKVCSFLLRHDSVLAAEAGDADGAVRAARAALGAARAIGDHPSMLGQFNRSRAGANAVRAAESAVNLGEPAAGLAELQAEFLRESEAPKLLTSLRSERASFERLCARVESGAAVGNIPDGGFRLNEAKFTSLVVRTHLRGDLAHGLDRYTRHVEAAKLPPEKRLAAVTVPRPPFDPRLLLTREFTSPFATLCELTLKSQGELAAASAGVACERYRRQFGQWPATLADIPKDILPAVPTDPCDGLPIKYVRLPGRVAVYSVGPDGVDHGGLVRDLGSKTPCDYGIRLYDVALRRQPAPPPVVEPDPFADLPDAVP